MDTEEGPQDVEMEEYPRVAEREERGGADVEEMAFTEEGEDPEIVVMEEESEKGNGEWPDVVQQPKERLQREYWQDTLIEKVVTVFSPGILERIVVVL